MQPIQNVTLAGRTVPGNQHVCAFFNSKEEEYRVLMPFIKEGFERGERAFHVVDPTHRSTHLKRLGEAGVPVDEAERKGQLEVRRWQEAYLRDGHFDQKRMIELIQEVLRDGKKRGYPLTRLVANMEWALEDRPGVNDIVEYESRLNYVLPKYDDVVVCTYDLAKFDAAVVMDIMRTHPMVIIGGMLQENPFYVPPDEFLQELRERRSEGELR
jgi:hypothetical protein